eukprot:CAMPEP_0198290392 /NCGR_PEP_ID=MMETSP1449-20131203/8286_1 /TAXON_ID=420275 /ORGANISM="Attheya septentrionalis, Strain CCMP2084" /LENGTH=1212 /DNA_ID=CAMNT_0043988897 /DNA_START=249 /DNA_END=3887 /DNA_ORIENTATION=-
MTSVKDEKSEEGQPPPHPLLSTGTSQPLGRPPLPPSHHQRVATIGTHSVVFFPEAPSADSSAASPPRKSSGSLSLSPQRRSTDPSISEHGEISQNFEKHLTFHDVVPSSLEAEADAAILSALEHNSRSNQQSHFHPTSTIINNSAEATQRIQQLLLDQSNPELYVPDLILPVLENSVPTRERAGTTGTFDPPPIFRSHRRLATAPGFSIPSPVVFDAPENVGLVPEFAPKPSHSPRHRRGQSRMFDLATQLRDLHEGSIPVDVGGGYLKNASDHAPTNKWAEVAQRVSLGTLHPSNATSTATTMPPVVSESDRMIEDIKHIFGHEGIPSPVSCCDNVDDSRRERIKTAENISAENDIEMNTPNDETVAATVDPTKEAAIDGKLNILSQLANGLRGKGKMNRNKKQKQSSNHRNAKNYELFKDFISTKKESMVRYMVTCWFCFILPALTTSAILFYGGNPQVNGGASYSYWLQFICRQVITFTMSKAFEVFFIEFLCLRTRISVRHFGPFFTLMMVQARGWPYSLTFWCVLDFCILYGDAPFSKHWLFFQEPLAMFNASNPSGDIVYNNWYMRALLAGITAGVCTTAKRVVVGTNLGKHSYANYGRQLEKLMQKMLLIGEVAYLSKEIEEAAYLISQENYRASGTMYGWDFGTMKKNSSDEDDYDEEEADEDEEQDSTSEGEALAIEESFMAFNKEKQDSDQGQNMSWMKYRKDTGSSWSGAKSHRTIHDPDPESMEVLKEKQEQKEKRKQKQHDKAVASLQMSPVDGFKNISFLQSSERKKILHLLEKWVEPEIKIKMSDRVTILDVLQFRLAISCMDDNRPFSPSFGLARKREECVESACAVYKRLMAHTPNAICLPFETLCLVALDNEGKMDEEKLKALVRLFRPNRSGDLTMLDFIKSCDKAYKATRLFQASIANSSQIDAAYESLINVVFYFILGLICLIILDLDPVQLFLSFSGIFLSFAFMFGSAGAKYFEGILLIAVRRPYDIGDRIALSFPNNDVDANGSMTWFVEKVTLFTTTVRLAATNEVATLANGSLADSRIINGARSPKATVYIHVKFSVDIPYEHVKLFRSAVEVFVKARPREWVSLNAMRAIRVETDLGFIEYSISLTHRSSFQDMGAILQSKADATSYCLELSKKLNMKFTAPAMPVTLGLDQTASALFRQHGFDQTSIESFPDGLSRDSVSMDTPDIQAVNDLFIPQSLPEKKIN